jgi:hypothetical protein
MRIKIDENLPTMHEEAVSEWIGCFVVASETNIRSIRPPKSG